MNLLDRLRSWWPSPQLVRAAADYRANVVPPFLNDPRTVVTLSQSVTLPAVYRAVQIITTAVSQLTLDVERQGQVVAETPALIRRPSVDMSRSDFLEAIVMSLVATGNAFILKDRAGTSSIINLTPLDPNAVTAYRDPKRGTRFGWNGREYGPDEIEHIHLFRLPGQLLGVGPIQQAAQDTIRQGSDLRDYSSAWFDTSGQPSGVLSSDQALTSADALAYRNRWNGLDDEGKPLAQADNPSRVKVLGKGLTYSPIFLSPKDAMWLESQQFTTLEVARIFGIPTSLMLAAPDGNSMTYQNVEQEWLAFTRFTLMQYLRKIEEALTNVTPNGQVVRFRIEALLRADTKTRYEAHEIAIRSGFLTPDEVRDIEGRPPLTASQRKTLTPTPAQEGTPA